MKSILTLIFIFFNLFALADTVLFEEDFEYSGDLDAGKWSSGASPSSTNQTNEECEGVRDWSSLFAGATHASTVDITIPSGGTTTLTFEYKFDKSGGTMPVIKISQNGGAYNLEQTLAYQTNCKTEIIDLSSYGGSDISIKFKSADAGGKFQVDNISLTHSSTSCSSVYFEEDFGSSVQANYLTNNGWCHADDDNNSASDPCDGCSCYISGKSNNRTGTFHLDATTDDIILSLEYIYDDDENSTAQAPIVSIKSGSACNNNYNQILQLEKHLTCYSVSTVIPATYYGHDVHLKFLTYNSGGKFTLDNIKVQKCDAVLPIELINFKGKTENKEIVLEWTTNSEINSSFFEIERSFDGINFEYVDEIKASGNSSSVIDYQYIDKEANKRQVYYRLKQVDYDGQFEYSKIVAVEMSDEINDVKIYLNRNKQAVLEFIEPFNGIINLFDLTGRLVSSQKLTDTNKTLFSELKNGVYLIQIENKFQENITQKLIVR